MNNKKTKIHIKSAAISALLQSHIPDFALANSYTFVDGSLLLNCRIDKLPQKKEDIFTLLCSETPWGGELSENKQAILDTLEVFECKTVEGFYGDTVADVTDYIEEAAYKQLGVREGAQFDEFCSDAAACNCELKRLYKLDGESVKLVKEEFEIIR